MSEIEDMKKVLNDYNKARATIKSKNEELRYATISVQEDIKRQEKQILQLTTRMKAEKEKLESSIETPFEQYRREVAQEPKDDRFEQEVRKAQQEKIKSMEEEIKRAEEAKVKQEKENKEKVESAEKRLQERRQQLMNGVASQENIIAVNKGLKSLDGEIRKKQIELSKKEIEVQEYFNDIEEGKKNKNILDLYKEVDIIKDEIKKLESDKDKYSRFLDVLKGIRDKSMQKEIDAINQAIARPKVEPQEKKPETKQEPTNETVENKSNLTPEQIEVAKKMQQQMENGTFHARDAKNIHIPTREEVTEPASVTMHATKVAPEQYTPEQIEAIKKMQQEVESPTFNARDAKDVHIGVESKKEITHINIDARTGRVDVVIDTGARGTINKEVSLQDAVENRKQIFKTMKIKQMVQEYCEKNEMRFFEKLKLRRSINPAVVEAIQLYGDNKQLDNYIQSLGGNQKLGFSVHYNLKDADETTKSFKLMNKIAKRNKDVEGITAEGIKENLWDKLVNRVKQARMPAPEEVKSLNPGEEKTNTTENAREKFAKENEVSEEVKENINKVEEKAQAEKSQEPAQETSQEKSSESER